MFRLRFGGMLRRALEAEVRAGTAGPIVRQLAVEADRLFEDWCRDAAAVDTFRPLPVATLVGVQYGAILATATTLDRRS